jgi:hypothetical protein
MKRQAMSPQERRMRSRLTQLVHAAPMLRGTLTVRRLTCGNKSCRCYRGEKHEALYLTFQRDGRSYQCCIPKELEEQVRQWSENYRRACNLFEEVCQTGYEALLHAKKRRKKKS